MSDEFNDALSTRLKAELPGVVVMERLGNAAPQAGQVTFYVTYNTSGEENARIISVVVDIDVWHAGPSSAQATELANLVELALIDWRVTTTRQGRVRLNDFSRANIQHDDERLAHITMRFTGRAFRRLET